MECSQCKNIVQQQQQTVAETVFLLSVCEVLIVSQSHQQEHKNMKKKQQRLFGVYEQNSIATESETYRIKPLTWTSCIGLATSFSRCTAVFSIGFCFAFFRHCRARLYMRVCVCVKIEFKLVENRARLAFFRCKKLHSYTHSIHFSPVRFSSVRFGWDKIKLQNSVCDCYGPGINKLWIFCSLLVAYDSVPSLFWSSL